MLNPKRRNLIILGGALAGALVLLLVSLHSNPTSTISQLIRNSDRVVITTNKTISRELGLEDFPAFITLTTSEDKSALARLIQCESEFGLTMWACACSGHPLIRVEKTDRPPLTISIHHGVSIRMDRHYTSNFYLTPRSEKALADYFQRHRVPTEDELATASAEGRIGTDVFAGAWVGRGDTRKVLDVERILSGEWEAMLVSAGSGSCWGERALPALYVTKTRDGARLCGASAPTGECPALDLAPATLAEFTRELLLYAEHFFAHGEEGWNSYLVYEIRIKSKASGTYERVFYGPSNHDDPKNREYAGWLRSIYPHLRALECER